MQFIDFQGYKIAFFKQGEGIPIFFLHGFCEDSRIWEGFLTHFKGFKTLRIDLPGFGNSEFRKELSIAEMAEGVHAVLARLDIRKCFLIGHSMGGYVGLEFAKKHPDMLMGLCLFHSHPYADSEEKKEARDKAIEFIRQNGHVLYVKQLIPKLFASDFKKGHPLEVEKLIYYACRYTPEAIIAALKAMRDREDNSVVLEKIGCPVLFIIGKKDAAVPLENSLAQTALPALADIRIFPDIGHMGMFEAPRQTGKLVKEFIDRALR